MALFRRWFLIGSVLVLGGGPLLAAGGREERALAAATAQFQDENWERAEAELAQFVQRFPKSAQVPSAVLLEAQAQFKQAKYADAIALLSVPPANVGSLADRYAYWLGEAQFANGDFTNAAATFSSLAKNFPDSTLRLTAVVEAAEAYAQLKDWPSHDALLAATNGVFARAALLDPDNALVINGRLSLAQSKLAQTNYMAAGEFLDLLNSKMLAPEQDWDRLNLLYQDKLGLNDVDAALAVTTNLMQSAKDAGQVADSVAMQATALEKKNLLSAALAVWSQNLTNSAPGGRQREAILKIAALAAEQNDFTDSAAELEKYLAQFTNSPVVELALLTLGELHLKSYAAQPLVATNDLAAAQQRFDQLIGTFTNSPLAGKAHLDRGWCNWLAAKNAESGGDAVAAAQKYQASHDDFSAATQSSGLPPEELTVAEFKAGDAMFALKDFTGARQNYQAVLAGSEDFPENANALADRALYQILRADLELKDAADADATMAQLLAKYPASQFAEHGKLLLGEAFSEFDQPVAACRVFQDFAQQFPNSALTPQVELAVARTFERGTNWPAAITNYEAWLKNYPTNDLQPQVQYALGWANYQAGRETNALQIFTAFVARFPADTNAPLAQWWVADHFFRLGGTNLVAAEQNYELIFQTPAWKNSALYYPAQLMAGRAAEGRQDFQDAANYLTQLLAALLADTNSPSDMKTRTRFAYGGVLMQLDSPDTNRPTANYELATNVFVQIIQANPTNEAGALAWCELAKCQLQLLNFTAATNAFAQAVNSPFAGIALRSRAQVGLGLTLEKLAATLTGTNQLAALQQARDNYLDVFDTWTGNDLPDGEMADSFWVQKAGLSALPLVEKLGMGSPDDFITRMETLFPQLKDSLEKKRAALDAVKN